MNKFYFAYGGGCGDIVYDYLTSKESWFLPTLVEDYGCKIRAYSVCHNDGINDLYRFNPYVHQHLVESWRPANDEDHRKFNNPIVDDQGEWFPLHKHHFVAALTGPNLRLVKPQIFLCQKEKEYLARLLEQRPCIVLQPFAGLSDRDGFDPPAIKRLFDNLLSLDPRARLCVVGWNHERNHKYSREECGFEHPNLVDLIDRAGIRLSYHLVSHCDAFCGAHSNLIRTAWDYRRRTALVLPEPLMTDHWPKLDPKYTYGAKYDECQTFTFPFNGEHPRQFDKLDTLSIAKHLLGRQ